MAIRRSSNDTSSAARIGAIVAASVLGLGVLVASASDSVTGVIAATWQASSVLGGG